MTTALEPPPRLTAIDAFRGFVMFLMLAEVLHLPKLAAKYPDEPFLQTIKYHTSHVEWTGCSLHDLIQPSFSFLVGVSLPFSLASRRSKEQSRRGLIVHALSRALLLIWLGIFLRSVGKPMTYWTFEDTLTQIGLGYPFLFLLAYRGGPRAWWLAVTAILLAVWSAFVLWPLPGPDFDYAKVGVPATWPYHQTGLAAHWNKNSNLAWAFDTWWLNLFPRTEPFVAHRGGYATLSFLPTLATMILGLIAGEWLRQNPTTLGTLGRCALAGLLGIALGTAADAFSVCPSVKRIWTPSWVLFSGGWCFLILGAFTFVTEYLQRRRWAYPLVVFGRNSILIYCWAHLTDDFVLASLKTHLGPNVFLLFGPVWEEQCKGAAILMVDWLLLVWLDRQRLYVKL